MNDWVCRKCDAVFRTRRLLFEHKKGMHKPENELQYSYTYNEEERSYTCNTCDTEVQTLPEITAHLRCHQEKFSCGDCNQDFPSAYKYSVHVQRQHSTDGLYRCATCEYVTPRVTAILQHINRTHLKKYPHYCRHCGKGFGDAVVSKEHENIHLGLKPFACVVCGKDFAISKYLLMHQVKNHTVTIIDASYTNQCQLCGKEFSSGITLEKHLKRHETSGIPKPKKHLCDSCGKGFATKDKLTLHYRTHTGYKPYKCSYCEKCFTKKDYLVMHERVHSGEKPYSCEYCGKSFNQDSPLRIHLRSHTGEKPYPCHLCSNKFVSKGALKCHLKSCQG